MDSCLLSPPVRISLLPVLGGLGLPGQQCGGKGGTTSQQKSPLLVLILEFASLVTSLMVTSVQPHRLVERSKQRACELLPARTAESQ